MALTDAGIESFKGSGRPAGIKRTDGKALYIHVTDVGKYWRMNYIFAGKRKTLAFGVYPAVSIADARLQRDKARKLLANGIDPGAAQKADRRAISAKAENQRPKHPGAVLRETVIPGLAVAPERMAELLGVSANVLMQVLGEHQAVNCTIAVGLENLLGTSAESWMQMQLEVDLWDARQELNRFAQFGRTLSIKDLAAMPNDSHVETDFLLPAATNAAHLAAAIAQHTAGIAERHELAGMQTLPLVPNGTQ